MIMYHGTIKGYADSILRDGIKPMPSQSFHVNRIANPIDDGVYLADTARLANLFSRVRADYSKLEPGEDSARFPMWKRKDAQPILADVDTTPVILKVEIPDNEMDKWEMDSDTIMWEGKGYRCHCTIPASYIKGVVNKVEEGVNYDQR